MRFMRFVDLWWDGEDDVAVYVCGEIFMKD